jgi:hypothetical protein
MARRSTSQSALHKTLQQISNHMTDPEWKCIRFICGKNIPLSEELDSGMELFTVLLRRDYISENNLYELRASVVDIFEDVVKRDLITGIIDDYHLGSTTPVQHCKPVVDERIRTLLVGAKEQEFDEVLKKAGGKLTTEDFVRLAFMVKMNPDEVRKNFSTAYDWIKSLKPNCNKLQDIEFLINLIDRSVPVAAFPLIEFRKKYY